MITRTLYQVGSEGEASGRLFALVTRFTAKSDLHLHTLLNVFTRSMWDDDAIECMEYAPGGFPWSGNEFTTFVRFVDEDNKNHVRELVEHPTLLTTRRFPGPQHALCIADGFPGMLAPVRRGHPYFPPAGTSPTWRQNLHAVQV